MQIEKYLESLGLTNKEIKIYLANLELGESAIMPIVKKTELPRTTVYHILEKLKDQGLIEILETRTRRIYIPHQPRKILTLLEQKQDKLKEDIDSFTKSLAELVRLYDFSPFMPKIRIYQNKELKKIYDEMLEAPVDEIWYVSEIGHMQETLGTNYFRNWIKQRIAKGIKVKGIQVQTKTSTEPFFYKSSKEYLRSVRYAPEGFQSQTNIAIYGDSVAFLTTKKENIGLVITSRDIATTMKNWFRELWKVSK